MKTNPKYTGLEIAIVGIACRFPGAANWREFWNNLVNGVESTRFFSTQELLDMGVDPETISRPDYVPAINRIKDKDRFDSSFFDYLPGEARLMNPTHRLFHECVWEAMEDAGYSAPQQKDTTGVFAGADDDLNWRVYAMLENRKQQLMDEFSMSLVAKQDNLATLVSYKLNLKGPAITLNTACSTSLTAIDMACKSLLLGESRMALAGGITVVTEKQAGYFYKEGMIYSSDGHCRPFDSEATGTTGSEGVGVVVLKKLNDALKDGDQVYAIIKGSSVNNDGNDKVGFTAPSVTGQADCIRKAHRIARVEPDTIGYVEAHGTATRLGDPIEVEALTIAFKNAGHSCALGSVKSNIGHTGSAAGVAGLIKTALCLKHGMIPPSINYTNPNPAIDFSSGPFYVNQSLKKWERKGDAPLRAGISSFGIGGTNVHAVLEEPPTQEETNDMAGYKLLTLSAKTEKSLRRYIDRFKNFIASDEPVNLADMAYTFQVGRKHFEYRRSIAFSNREELLSLLEAEAQEPVTRAQDGPRKIVFMFSGQGAQYAHMAADLYKDVPQFREEMDKGLALLRQLTGEDFKEVLFPSAGQEEKINETRYTQPLLFVLEYALARVVMSLGLVPSYMIGHSIGEYTAAALSGVLSFEDAVRLVAKRGELMNSLPTGSMLSVLMSEEEAKALATGNIYLAAVNAPGRVVFSGEKEAIDALHNQLKAQDISCIPLQTSHAFHSGMQDPILDEFRSEVAKTTFGKITTPFVSNLTGNFITEEQASSPDYWTSHLRNTVQFSAGIQALLAEEGSLQFIEVGPGQSLSGLLKQQPGQQAQTPVNLVRSEKKTAHDLRHFTEALGQLWTLGTSIDWNIYHKDEKRRRISLPTYSFEPTKYITEVSLEGSGLSPDISLINLTSQENNEGSEQETGPAPSNDPEDESLTPTERKVKALFRSFFGVETLSLSDNFFTLGGDSLKATRLASQVHREFGVQLSLNIFFENPTIGELARIIGQSLKTAYVGIEKAPDREFYPLSSAQNRLFFLQEFAPQSTGYNMPMVSYMGKEADPRRIDAVLHQLIARHESLRTSFVKIDGAAVQKIHEEVSFQLDTHECLPQEFENYFRSYIRPFDLAQAPLLRSSLVHIKEAGYAWIVDLHHIISDGTSQQVLAEDFMRLYRGEELPELRLQYRDFSEWQNNMQQSGELQKQKEYWLSRFSDGIPRLDLPADRVRPALFTFEGSMHSFTIHPELTTAVRAFYSNNHSTLQMTLLSVLNVLLYKYTGQDDLVIGHGIAGRRHADLEGIVGMFVNTLAIRTFPEGEKSFHNFHKEVAAACLAAYDNQDIQFEDLVKMLQVERDPSRNPVFDIALLVQNFKRSDESLSGIINPGAFAPELTQTTSHVTSKFDMTWFVEERGEDLLVNLEYYSAIYDRSTIERLSAHFVNILAAVMENPELLIEEIPLVDTASEKDLLEAYGYASGSGVHGAR